jgi:hypothetical protein
MDLAQTVLEALVGVARALWAGVAGALLGGWLGGAVLWLPGMALGAAIGALLGTVIGSRLRVAVIRRMTGTFTTDVLLQAGGALTVAVLLWWLYHLTMLMLLAGSLAFLAWAFLSG